MLQLPFVNEGDKGDLRMHVNLMNGWKWNLIVMLLLGFVACVLVVGKLVKVRKPQRIVYAKVTEQRLSSPYSAMGEV